jgi:hypothetical protein
MGEIFRPKAKPQPVEVRPQEPRWLPWLIWAGRFFTALFIVICLAAAAIFAKAIGFF